MDITVYKLLHLLCCIVVILSNQLCMTQLTIYLFYYLTDIFPINFEGAKLVFNKGLSNHFHISHTINMSSVVPSGYR